MELEEEKSVWWGYLHTSGSLQAKRYFGKQDIDEALESPFVENVVCPFLASDREEALKYISEKTKTTII